MASQPSDFVEVAVLTHAEAADGVAEALLSLGARGVAEERRPLALRVVAYFPCDDDTEQRVRAVRARLTALERQGLRVGPGTVSVRTLAGAAWADAWKAHFQVMRIAPGLVVAPTWENYQPQPGESVILLDPGGAFGTGGHATTRLCLRTLLANIRPGDRVGDIGCGSGILAITAAILGAAHVVATDNDPSVFPVAQANARLNGVHNQIQFVETDLVPKTSDPFDVIVCNIVAEEIIRLAEDIRGLLSRGGRFIGSGFVTASLPRVETALGRAGLDILETPSDEGWAACVAVRPGHDRSR